MLESKTSERHVRLDIKVKVAYAGDRMIIQKQIKCINFSHNIYIYIQSIYMIILTLSLILISSIIKLME